MQKVNEKELLKLRTTNKPITIIKYGDVVYWKTGEHIPTGVKHQCNTCHNLSANPLEGCPKVQDLDWDYYKFNPNCLEMSKRIEKYVFLDGYETVNGTRNRLVVTRCMNYQPMLKP